MFQVGGDLPVAVTEVVDLAGETFHRIGISGLWTRDLVNDGEIAHPADRQSQAVAGQFATAQLFVAHRGPQALDRLVVVGGVGQNADSDMGRLPRG